MKLALGTVQFGLNYGVANQSGQVGLEEAKAILNLAVTNRIDTLDTAIAYGDSEQRLGQIGISNWKVVTKLPSVPDGCENVSGWVFDQIERSRKRLNTDSLYGLLLHQPNQLINQSGNEVYQALIKLKKDGFVQKIGVSIYEPSELDALYQYFQFDLIQAPFNILDRRLVESGWMSRLAESNIELHVRTVFLQGLLLMSKNERPHKFNKWLPLWEMWHDWLKEAKLTPLQACLSYVLSFPEISKVVVGVDGLKQFIEILDAAKCANIKVPEELKSSAIDLINPGLWSHLG